MTSTISRPTGSTASTGDADLLRTRYDEVRGHTEVLSAPLSPEDQTVQSMADVSPTKWHRAHVTWFFETFLLAEQEPGFAPFQDRYWFLFNSYYEALGPRYARAQRGAITRPGAHDVGLYRRNVDDRVRDLLARADGGLLENLAATIELGFHHEQQHQELLLMDIKHVLSLNPLQPVYAGRPSESCASGDLGWVDVDGGLVEVGHRGHGFSFDNELPRTAPGSSPTVSRTGWSPTESGSSSSPTAGTAAPTCGSPTGGARSTARAGRLRSTGRSRTTRGSSTPSTARGRSTPVSR